MKALALLSGGLDSTLAVRLIMEQGIEVEGLNFVSTFCQCNHKGRCFSDEVSSKFGIPLKTMVKGEDYLEVVRHPRHGYGSGMNPCIDCRIYIFRKAREYAEEIDARFIFTGEVLEQRPKSQFKTALDIIDREAGLEGKVLRPLSAKLLPETEAERMGWVDRSRLLDIRGRSRKRQIELADNLGVTDYPCPSGGCLLTQKEFAERLRKLFRYQDSFSQHDAMLLKVGRHFWHNGSHIVVGRNQPENRQLMALKGPADYYFEVPGCGSPVTILLGEKSADAVERAASLTARYSDAASGEVSVEYGPDGQRWRITVGQKIPS
ncbi:MAG: hypothetical protein HYX91_03030 [Chloroflexi bacterium]|nr:hypothetical protein [Chloroflexota bacterium]